jgi:predicted dehydrogenase
MKLLVVGLGSIGRRHIRNLKRIAPEVEVGVWRQHTKSADLGELAPLVSKVFFAEDEALAWGPEAALVANPASRHVAVGLALARANAHLFVEKPLSTNLQNVTELVSCCHERSLVLMVGYGFRFYPPLQQMKSLVENGRIGRPLFLRAEVGQYLPDWRPQSDYRNSVSARRELGGGALLELSHELDYARWLLGETGSVNAVVGQLSDLPIDVEDVAELILRFSSGAIGNLHLDMVQRSPARSCRIAGTEGTLTWDSNGHRVCLFEAGAGRWTEVCAAESFDFNQVYQAELRHFLECAAGNAVPPVDGEQGARIVEMVLAAQRSSCEGKEIRL